ncbi:transposase [Galbibacter pacificus]|uniref:Transposase n=1 Tax=Galbibacter pacificus TaxID=2996052 RepID=A0ABT6FW08_9FLAO|nr:transposase [Galbibacter pacificus]MDG3584114.1 transposase [Galbibacter pacificus]MDG3587453.1 transposase [Galbibacter pacificus]
MNITESYLSRAELWMLITTLFYFLMNGAQIFETAVLVPKWTANPPDTFALLANKNGASLKVFWIILHSLHELTFILAIVFCWKLIPIRNGLLIFFAIHFAVRAWTLSYFATNIIEFQKVAEGLSPTADMVKRANMWQSLNYIRVAIFVALSIGMIPLFLKLLNIKNN